tara:strand:+ start:29 stop:475 length:447 start_codon:yes stop_codon:yes gene_type:complete
MEQFCKDPYPLYSIIFLNLMMCFFGFSVSYTKMTTEWGKGVFCTLWIILFFMASGNQGYAWNNKLTRWGDRTVAASLLLLYTYFYWNTMEWWHFGSGIIASVGFLFIERTYINKMQVYQYTSLINIWHLWITFQIFLIPYSLPEGPLA